MTVTILILSLSLNLILLSVLIVKSFNLFFSKKINLSDNYDTIQKNIQQHIDITAEKYNVAVDSMGEKLIVDIQKLLTDNIDTSNLHEVILRKISTAFEAGQGVFYTLQMIDNSKILRFKAGYAFYVPDDKPIEFVFGEGLIGQVAKDKKPVTINAASIEHTPIFSGLGKANPDYIIICPIVKNDNTIGVMEFSSFTPFTEAHENILTKLAALIANTIENNQ